jgi:hypothetical protein
VKVDPKTAHAIFQGRMTAVLRTRKLERQREPVQFERARGEDDARPKHADDLTVLDTKCYVLVLEQRDLAMGDLTDVDAKLLGHRSLFMLKLSMGDEWRPRRQMWLVVFKRHDADKSRFLAPVSGYTESRHMSIDPDAEIVEPHMVRDVNARRAKGLDHAAQEELRRRAARVRAAKLRDSEQKAIGMGVDVSAEVAAIDAYLETIRQKVSGEEAA